MSLPFKLRPARPEDVKFLFDLSNDPLVRRNSANSKPIEWDGHVKWYSRMLESPDCIFYIVTSPDGEPIGQCRFNRLDGGWNCSGSLVPAWRGRGLSKLFLRAALMRSGVREMVGFSKVANKIAIKPLKDNGYRYLENRIIDGEEYEVYKWTAPTFVIAEMSANHRGDLERAKDIVRAAAAAGAGAVKLQTYTADTMTLDCQDGPFRIHYGTPWDGMTMHELYAKSATPWSWTEELAALAGSLGIELFSSPFDRTAVDHLEACGVKRYKIASFEAADLPLVRYIASKRRPVLISTGVLTLGEIRETLDACHAEGNYDVTLMKCTSAYPAMPESMNLATIRDMIERFGGEGVAVGLSDHTTGIEVPVAAVAMGARTIEKHFTLDRPAGDAESSFALTPEEFGAMVKAVRLTDSAVGRVVYEPSELARAGCRSLYVAEDVREGEEFTARNLRSVRPAGGCAPKLLPQLLGRKASRDLRKGEPMREEYAR